jgi:putative membrane protein
MRYFFIRTLAVLITSYITRVGVPMVLAWKTGFIALVAAVVLAVINHTIKPVLSVISVPINFLTLGLFSFVLNGFMILLAARIVDGFHMPSLLYAIYFATVLSIVNWILHVVE